MPKKLTTLINSGLSIDYEKEKNTGFGFRVKLVYFKEQQCTYCGSPVTIIYNRTLKSISSNGGIFLISRKTGETVIACNKKCAKKAQKR